MAKLHDFQDLLRRAHEAGVLEDFTKRFRALRRQGYAPLMAGEEAMKQALALKRAHVGVTVSTKEGKA